MNTYSVSIHNQSIVVAGRDAAHAGAVGLRLLGYDPQYTGQHDLTVVELECSAPTVAHLAALVSGGDWHDAPMKYGVFGPGSERQLFSTRKDALKYASLRRRSNNQGAAINAFR